MEESSDSGWAGFQFGRDLSTSDNCREVSRKGGIACSREGSIGTVLFMVNAAWSLAEARFYCI